MYVDNVEVISNTKNVARFKSHILVHLTQMGLKRLDILVAFVERIRRRHSAIPPMAEHHTIWGHMFQVHQFLKTKLTIAVHHNYITVLRKLMSWINEMLV